MAERFQKCDLKGKGYYGKDDGTKGGGKASKGKGESKGKGKGYDGQNSTTIFDGACRICGQTGHTQAYCPAMGLGLLGTCDYCGQIEHSRRYCPVENDGNGKNWNYGKGYSQEEPEQETEDTCIKCLSEGEEAAFGGYVGWGYGECKATQRRII